MQAPFEDGAAGIATWRHCDLAALRPGGIATMWRCDLAALRQGGIAARWHRGQAALRPCDSRLGLRTVPVAVRSCRRQCLGLAGCRHCGVAAVRKSGQRLFASPDSRCPGEERN
jgi:hypothetical protein